MSTTAALMDPVITVVALGVLAALVEAMRRAVPAPRPVPVPVRRSEPRRPGR